jgi:hypothetical protein
MENTARNFYIDGKWVAQTEGAILTLLTHQPEATATISLGGLIPTQPRLLRPGPHSDVASVVKAERIDPEHS